MSGQYKAGLIAILMAIAPNVTDASDRGAEIPQCMQTAKSVPPGGNVGAFGSDLAAINLINSRAATLASAYKQFESALSDAGYPPSEISAKNQSWVGITDDSEILVAIYERQQSTIKRIDAFGTDRLDQLLSRLAIAEQALVHTPQDCGTSFAVVDAGIEDSDASILYSMLLPPKDKIAWGMHYRFTAKDGSLARVERLHSRCSVTSGRQPTIDEMSTWEPSLETLASFPGRVQARIYIPRRGVFIKYDESENAISILHKIEIMPHTGLPSEAQIAQFHLNPAIPFDIIFWTKDKALTVEQGEVELPRKFWKVENPCIVDADADHVSSP